MRMQTRSAPSRAFCVHRQTQGINVRLSILLAVLASILLSGPLPAAAQQKEKTYKSTLSGSRIDACNDARSSAELYSKNELSCAKVNVSVGRCDCEVTPETATTNQRHTCLVVAKISCLDQPSSSGNSGSGSKQEVKSFSSTTVAGGTRAEACSGAKKEAEFWSNLNRYSVASFSSCDCSEGRRDTISGPEIKWTCGVDASLRPR